MQREGATKHGGCTHFGGVNDSASTLGDQQPMDKDIQKKLDEVFKGQEQMKTNSLYSVNSFRGLAVAKSEILLEPQLRAS